MKLEIVGLGTRAAASSSEASNSGSTVSGGRLSDRGWEGFRAELTAQLEAMADGSTLEAYVVDVLQPTEPTVVEPRKSWLSRFRPRRVQEGQPYIQFAPMDGILHMEASSNRFLAPHWQLDNAAAETLERLGWSPPAVEPDDFESANYFIDRPLADALELVDVVVQTLVEVFGVRDPATLNY